MFFHYYLVLFQKSVKLMANPVITNIGGMCYTIYLLHYPIISMFGNPLLQYSFSTNSMVNSVAYFLILLTVVMVLSAIYFIMIERPCMDKDWYKKLFKLPTDKAVRENWSVTVFASKRLLHLSQLYFRWYCIASCNHPQLIYKKGKHYNHQRSRNPLLKA